MADVLVWVNSAHEDLRYVREAVQSARSFRPHYPNAEFVLYTNASDFWDPAFDHVEAVEFYVPEVLAKTAHMNGQMVAKLSVLPRIEADRVMYLGSDIYALRPEAGSLLNLLDRFDIAAAHAPNRINTSWGNHSIPEVPVSFPEYNCDLVLWRRSEATTRFLEDWRARYMAHDLGHPHDQGPFRLLAYESDLRIATLPPEFNHRGPEWRKDTVILHNRNLLPAYLDAADHGSPSRPLRAVNHALRRIGFTVRLDRKLPSARQHEQDRGLRRRWVHGRTVANR